MCYISNSIEETFHIASNIAEKVSPGTIIALKGDLGTGKTTFTQGFAHAIGVKELVGSPTFKLISEYEGRNFWLYHIDAYRLKGAYDFLNIGGEEYLFSQFGVTIIEWADIIMELLPDNTININFHRIQNNANGRKIEIDGLENVF